MIIKNTADAQKAFGTKGLEKSFVARAKKHENSLKENWKKIRQAFIDIGVPKAELN